MNETEKKLTCRYCKYHGMPNVVRTMGGRKAEYFCYRCGNSIAYKYNARKAVREGYTK